MFCLFGVRSHVGEVNVQHSGRAIHCPLVDFDQVHKSVTLLVGATNQA
jgi:hypothetical protein